MERTQYRIAVVGDITEDSYQLRTRAEDTLKEIRQLLQAQAGDACALTILTAPEGLKGAWAQIQKSSSIPTVTLPAPWEWDQEGVRLQDHARRTLVQVSDMADLMLGFWDENPDDAEFFVWETLHRCMEKHVPCLWFSKKDGKAYWAERILFEPFQDAFLQAHLGAVHPNPEWNGEVEDLPWGNRLIAWGNRLYKKMLAKYAVASKKTEADGDSMMQTASPLGDANGEAARRHLLEAYREHDNKALQLSEKYRGSIYWRSILPMAATILLAIGFYADSVAAVFWGTDAIPRFVFLLMSLAFFAHALMILFSHILARNRVIQSWHTQFLYHRIVAELLRYYIHVIPFGITLPLNRILSKSGFDTTQKQPVYVTIWQLLHNPVNGQPAYQEANVPEFLNSMEAYLCDQLAYHQGNAARFQKLRNRLRKLETRLVSAGIVIVALRGLAQFFIIGVRKELFLLGSGLMLPSYSGSIANMIAMIVPAVAAYYTGKLTLFGFEDSITMSQMMQERLEKAIALLRSMKGRNVNYSMVRNLAEQIGILMMGDLAQWNREMSKRRIKGL